MDAAHPTSLRHLLVRMAATLLALVVLFPLSYGPAVFVAYKFPSTHDHIVAFYDPLVQAIAGTPLNPPFDAYVIWWERRAGWDGNYYY